jgi:hypothetical protein
MKDDILIREKKGYKLHLDNNEPDAVHLITNEWFKGGGYGQQPCNNL